MWARRRAGATHVAVRIRAELTKAASTSTSALLVLPLVDGASAAAPSSFDRCGIKFRHSVEGSEVLHCGRQRPCRHSHWWLSGSGRGDSASNADHAPVAAAHGASPLLHGLCKLSSNSPAAAAFRRSLGPRRPGLARKQIFPPAQHGALFSDTAIKKCSSRHSLLRTERRAKPHCAKPGLLLRDCILLISAVCVLARLRGDVCLPNGRGLPSSPCADEGVC
jgi:hypothetical protein